MSQQNGQQNQVAKFSEDTVTQVLGKVSNFQSLGDLRLPANYSAENAVRSAWLLIQDVKDMSKRPALEVCTRESIANALLDMVLQGLNPVKKQCYFIVYGNKLTLQKSYMGNIAVSRRVADVKDVVATPIYEKDTFVYVIDEKTGKKHVTEHKQDFMNIDPQKVVGAWAIVTKNDGTTFCEIMNMGQIRAAWNMGNANGNSPAHKNFPDQMACKTVANRALKIAIGSSDDADLFEDEPIPDRLGAGVRNEIEQNANKKEIGFDEPEDQEPSQESEPEMAEESEEPAANKNGQQKLGPGF